MHRANVTSFKAGINPKTGEPAMNEEQLQAQKAVYYARHKRAIQDSTWRRQIMSLGCTPQQYVDLWIAQAGLCAICLEENDSDRKLAVDHDHVTGKIRGLLCNRCNTALGAFDHDDLLQTVGEYLCQVQK